MGGIEGVAADRSTGRVFVGDLNNGNVWVGTVSADAFTLFSNAGAVGRTSALGLATDEARRRLYVVAHREGRVDVIHLDNGSHLASIAMPGASSLNDVAVAPDGTTYVSDLGRPVVYRIAAGGSTGEAWVDYSGTSAVNTAAVSQHGNGLVADDNQVLVAYMVGGELLRFDRSTGAVSRVSISGSSTAGRDGLALCGNRLYGADVSFITGGADRVWITDLSADRTTGTSGGSITSPDFSGISTIAPIGGGLVVANAQFGVSPKSLPFWLTVVDAAC